MIDVWLKISERIDLNFVLMHLNYWLGVFNDSSKYKIWIYNENINLPNYYSCYDIINRNDLLSDVDCNKLFNLISKSQITPRWQGAGTALSAPYFFLKKNKLIYNIDAIDMMIYGPAKTYLGKLEKEFEEKNLITVSHDLHYTYHQGFFYDFRPHHFSMGVNLSDRLKMKDLILKSILKKVPEPPWGCNFDYQIDKALENIDTPYVCFVTPDYLVHTWNDDYKSVRNIRGTNMVENYIFKKTELKERHKRTLYIE